MNLFNWAKTATLAVFIIFTGLPVSAETQDTKPEISSDFSYEINRISLSGAEMAYVDIGDGPTLLLIHGNPTSSYLWRNVIPHLQSNSRVVALDLIGFGASDRPDIEYKFADHRAYLAEFIERMKLDDITFVAHDWGSALALDFATNNPKKVKGIALMEALLPPAFPFESFETMGPIGDVFRAFRDPKKGRAMLLDENFFIEKGLPGSVMQTLPEETMNQYRAPFPTSQDRLPIWRFTQEVPIAGKPADVETAINAYADWLAKTEVPILYLYAVPGMLNPVAVKEWMEAYVTNLEVQSIGAGLHYVQEDQPDAIGQAIVNWINHRDE